MTHRAPFAIEVRDAYLRSGSTGEPVTLTVRSPVTGRYHPMSCTGPGTTHCTGGDDAVVVLY